MLVANRRKIGQGHLAKVTHPALRDAAPSVFWLDRAGFESVRPTLTAEIDCDLLVIGSGYTGLWTALQALERDPGRDVVVIDATTTAYGASGRNGGFCDASLTHGIANGLSHFPQDIETLLQLGRDNLDAIENSLRKYNIDADFERTGQISVANAPWQVESFLEDCEQLVCHGEDAVVLDREQLRNHVVSPQLHGGLLHRSNNALVDPAKLCRGLAEVCEQLGARIFDATRCTGLAVHGTMIYATTEHANVRAGKVVIATNAFPGLIPVIRRRVVPVWDYVLMTEPLSVAHLSAIGWAGREGLSDAANLFHYFRLTSDDRILWGGYDALYYFNDKVDIQRREQCPKTFDLLARQFFATFPQLEGLRFTHRWGGPIATTSRFCATFGTTMQGRVSFAAGYTGLGVGASRFGARVALDLIDQPGSELLKLDFVQNAPIPFPPEPARYLGIQMTRRAIARSDANEGRRGPWLKLLDRFGVGFDS